MPTSRRNFGETMIDIIVTLVGIAVLLLAGYTRSTLAVSLLQALGTSLVAAGIITFLMRKVHARDDVEKDKVEIAGFSRLDLENEYIRRKYSAHQVDILSVALGGVLEELATDSRERMLKRTLFDGARVRLILLSPMADYVKQRAAEDAVSAAEVQAALKQSVAHCAAIYDRLGKLFRDADRNRSFEREKMGAIEIRLTDLCPHFTTYRTDGEIIWGLYTSAQRGTFSPALRVTRQQSYLYEQLQNHFDRLWDKTLVGKANDDNYLVRFYGPAQPLINERLFSRILGPDWKAL